MADDKYRNLDPRLHRRDSRELCRRPDPGAGIDHRYTGKPSSSYRTVRLAQSLQKPYDNNIRWENKYNNRLIQSSSQYETEYHLFLIGGGGGGGGRKERRHSVYTHSHTQRYTQEPRQGKG